MFMLELVGYEVKGATVSCRDTSRTWFLEEKRTTAQVLPQSTCRLWEWAVWSSPTILWTRRWWCGVGAIGDPVLTVNACVCVCVAVMAASDGDACLNNGRSAVLKCMYRALPTLKRINANYQSSNANANASVGLPVGPSCKSVSLSLSLSISFHHRHSSSPLFRDTGEKQMAWGSSMASPLLEIMFYLVFFPSFTEFYRVVPSLT